MGGSGLSVGGVCAAAAAMTLAWMTSTLPITSRIRSSCFLRRCSSDAHKSCPRSVEELILWDTSLYRKSRANASATKKNAVMSNP